MPHRSTSGPRRLAISIRPARTAGCSGCSGRRTVSCLMTPPFLHQRLAGDQTALAVFIVDQRQPAFIGGDRLGAAAGEIRIRDLADAVGITAAGHRAGRAGIEVGHQRDRLLAIPRAFDRFATERDQLAQFGGGLRRLDLEIGDILQLPRHAGEESRRQWRAGDRRILDHDGNRDRVRNGAEKLVDGIFPDPDGRAVIGRHHHHHGGPRLLGPPRALGTDMRGKMRCRDDDRDAAGDMASSTASSTMSRSASVNTNCSEKLARMQSPCEPASIMQSTARFWPSRSSRPSPSNTVGTTGNTPL